MALGGVGHEVAHFVLRIEPFDGLAVASEFKRAVPANRFGALAADLGELGVFLISKRQP